MDSLFPRRTSIAVAVLALGLCAAHATAQVTGARTNLIGGDLYGYQDALLVLNGHAFPTTALTPETRELKLVPVYLRLDQEFNTFGNVAQVSPPENYEEANGFGLALSYSQGLSEHWGFSIFGAWARLSGDALGIQEGSNASNPGIFAGSFVTEGDTSQILAYHVLEKSGFGIQGAAALVFDPFSDPDGFRLPVMFGVSAIYSSETLDQTVFSKSQQTDVRLKIEQENFLPGLFAGLSAQFDTGPIRWVPFISTPINLKAESRDYTLTRVSDGAVLFTGTESEKEVFKPSLGVSFTYKPWGLGASYIPNFFDIGDEEDAVKVDVFSLTKVFRF